MLNRSPIYRCLQTPRLDTHLRQLKERRAGNEKKNRFRAEIEMFDHPAAHHHAERAQEDDDDADVKGGIRRIQLELGLEEFRHKGREYGEDESLGRLIQAYANVRHVGGKRLDVVDDGTQHSADDAG